MSPRYPEPLCLLCNLPNVYARFPRTSKQYSAPLAFAQLLQNGTQFGRLAGPLDIVPNSSYDDITSTHSQQKNSYQPILDVGHMWTAALRYVGAVVSRQSRHT